MKVCDSMRALAESISQRIHMSYSILFENAGAVEDGEVSMEERLESQRRTLPLLQALQKDMKSAFQLLGHSDDDEDVDDIGAAADEDDMGDEEYTAAHAELAALVQATPSQPDATAAAVAVPCAEGGGRSSHLIGSDQERVSPKRPCSAVAENGDENVPAPKRVKEEVAEDVSRSFLLPFVDDTDVGHLENAQFELETEEEDEEEDNEESEESEEEVDYEPYMEDSESLDDPRAYWK